MNLAILTPVHGSSGARITLQLKNYQKWCKDVKIKFYIHPSLETTNKLTADLLRYAAHASMDIKLCPLSVATSFRSCLNAILAMDKMLSEDSFNADYVYYHSDSDLLFSDGVSGVISEHDFGVDVIQYTSAINEAWPHAGLMWCDQRFVDFVDGFLGGDRSMIRIGRIEGSFYKKNLWDKILAVVRTYFDSPFFDDVENHWCAEEILFPTLAVHPTISSIFDRRRPNLVFVKNPDSQLDRNAEEGKITVFDIQNLRANGAFHGAKWFSNDPADPARRLLL